MLYKQIENGYIPYLGNSKVIPQTAVEITEAEYNQIMEVIKTKPEDTLEAVYRLSAETSQYVACERTHDETVSWYLEKVMSGEITIDEVPGEYRAEVESKLPTPTEPTYTLDEAATILAQEVSA